MEKTKEEKKKFAALYAYCIFLFCYCNTILLYVFAIQTKKVWMFLLSLAMAGIGIILPFLVFWLGTREPRPKYQQGYPQQFPTQEYPQRQYRQPVPETLPEPPEVEYEEPEQHEMPDLNAQFQDIMQKFMENSQKQMAKIANHNKQQKRPVAKPAKKPIPTFKVDPKFATKTAPQPEDEDLED